MQHKLRCIVSAIALLAVAATVDAAPRWEPKPTPEMKKLTGVVVLTFDVDIDGDGKASTRETEHLTMLLGACDVRYAQAPDPARVGPQTQLLVIGTPIEPVLTEEARAEPIKIVEHEQAMYRFRDADNTIIRYRKAAAENGVRVVEAADLLKTLGLKPMTAEELAAMDRHALARRLRTVPSEARFADLGLKDVIVYFSDVAGLTITLDDQALKPAEGDAAKIPVTLTANELPVATVLELLADEVGGVFVTDGRTLRLTSAAAAAKMPGFEPAIQLLEREFPTAEETRRELTLATDFHLKRKLPEVSLQGIGFADVVDFLRDVSGVNLHLDRRALADAGIDINAPVNGKVKDLTFQQTLEMLQTASPKLAVYSHDGRVLRVTTKERAEAAVKASKHSRMIVPRPAAQKQAEQQ